MDIKMPEMDGIEATKQIRKVQKEVPIIAQTAYAFAEDKVKILDAGCNEYLTKPIRRSELLPLLKEYLNKSK